MKYLIAMDGDPQRVVDAANDEAAWKNVGEGESLYELPQNSGLIDDDNLMIEDGVLVAKVAGNPPVPGEGIEVIELDRPDED